MVALRWGGVQPGPHWTLTTNGSGEQHHAGNGSTVGAVWSRPGWLHVELLERTPQGGSMTMLGNLRHRIVFVETDRLTRWPSIRLVIYTRTKNGDSGRAAQLKAVPKAG